MNPDASPTAKVTPADIQVVPRRSSWTSNTAQPSAYATKYRGKENAPKDVNYHRGNHRHSIATWHSSRQRTAPLVSVIGHLLSGIIWLTTYNLINIERQTAEKAAITTVKELTETYEAQVVRVLREIDQELKLIRFTYGQLDGPNVLKVLERHDLLPPAFLFTVSILDSQGTVIADTGALTDEIDPLALTDKHRQGG